MQLGIAVASLQETKASIILRKISQLEKLLHTKFDFIEGINDRNLMNQLVKEYPCYTLGSLIRDPNKDIIPQFTKACTLANELNIAYLMFGGYQARINNPDLSYSKLFHIARERGLHLLLEPLKGTYPATLTEAIKLQHSFNEYAVHICLKNTELNKDSLDIILPSYIQNCHISLNLYLKYYDNLCQLPRVTLEL